MLCTAKDLSSPCLSWVIRVVVGRRGAPRHFRFTPKVGRNVSALGIRPRWATTGFHAA